MEKEYKKIGKSVFDKWFYFPIVVLGIYFIYRLINQSQMIFQFSFDCVNDYSAHMAQLHFLIEYGFHNFVPNWFNGFVNFLFYPPGWYFFTAPIYLLLNNLLLATYLSVILMFLIIFITIFIFGKIQKFSIKKRIVFFLFLFANSIAIGNYVRLGRVSELFALTCLVVLAVTILYFRNKRFNWKFFVIFIPFYFLIIIAHPSTAIIFHILLFSLFIVKCLKEKLMLIGASVVSVILSSFWWLPFLMNMTPEMSRSEFAVARRILDFSGGWAFTSYATFLVVGVLFFTFFIYWKGKRYSRKEILFFAPILITGFLFVTRIVVFIPLMVKVYPDVYMMFFLLFSIFFLLSVNLNKITPSIKLIIIIGLIVLPLLSVGVSEIHTPKFIKYTSFENDILDILPLVNGKFVMSSLNKSTSHPSVYYSYGAIYLNLSTPVGTNDFGTASKDYFERLKGFSKYLNLKDCQNLIETMKFMNTTNIITSVSTGGCDTLRDCGFKEIKTNGSVCLYFLED